MLRFVDLKQREDILYQRLTAKILFLMQRVRVGRKVRQGFKIREKAASEVRSVFISVLDTSDSKGRDADVLSAAQEPKGTERGPPLG